MYKLLRFYNQNRLKIWVSIIAIIFILAIIYILNNQIYENNIAEQENGSSSSSNSSTTSNKTYEKERPVIIVNPKMKINLFFEDIYNIGTIITDSNVTNKEDFVPIKTPTNIMTIYAISALNPEILINI